MTGESDPEGREPPTSADAEFALASEIFLALREIPSDERERRVDEACAGRPSLAALVRMLLAGDEAPFPAEALAEDIRVASEHASLAEGDETPRSSRGRDRIGPYHLLERIGEGGFGVVFLAEQQEPIRRRVALKIIKLGMDTRQVIARFESERQALALMDHPHIAKVFDAGSTPTGRPYFVMELVIGEPITIYCDRHALSVTERLELITTVCDAVQHAHQKGVIHRDLKPSNVLVTMVDGRHVPKVIDFGIAKATTARLTERTLHTEARQLIGTPEYMSPEQAGTPVGSAGSAVDTRSDVYSLGVMLYELLAGSTPFESGRLRSAAIAEVQRILRDEDPPRPSTRIRATSQLATIARDRRAAPAALERLVSGELDWIAMRAIEKLPARRYESPSALAADIARFLDGRPVVAAPPSRRYLIEKTIRRHRFLVASSAIVLFALILGLVATSLALARALRAEAEQRRLTTVAHEATNAEALRRSEAEGRSYEANIAAAAAAVALLDPGSARARLESADPALRDWEWHWLNAATDDALVRYDHGTRITHVSVNGDDRSPEQRLLTRGVDGRAVLFKAQTGERLRAFEPRDGPIGRARFSADGTEIVTSIRERGVTTWNTTTGARGPTWPTPGWRWIEDVAWSRDEKRIVTIGPDGEVCVVSLSDGQLLPEIGPRGRSFTTDAGIRIVDVNEAGEWTIVDDAGVKQAHVSDPTLEWPLALRHDGRRLAARSSKGIRLLHLDGDGPRETELDAAFEAHQSPTNDASFSRDGQVLAVATQKSGGYLWDVATGQLRARLVGHAGSVERVTFDATSTRLATIGNDQRLIVWDAKTGERVSTMNGHQAAIVHVVFPRSGTNGEPPRTVASVGNDRSVRLWDTTSGRALAVWCGLEAFVEAAADADDGATLWTGSGDGIARMWNLTSPPSQIVLAARDEQRTLFVARATNGREEILLDTQTGQLGRFDPLTGREDSTRRLPSGAVLSRDSRVYTIQTGTSLAVFDTATGTALTTLTLPGGALTATAVDRTMSRIAYGLSDRSIRVCRISDGQLLATLTPTIDLKEPPPAGEERPMIEFLSDSNRLLTAGRDGAVRLWSLVEAREVQQIPAVRPWQPPYRMQVAPDGVHAVVGGLLWPLMVWNTDTGNVVTIDATQYETTGPLFGVVGIAFSADGRFFASASQDQLVRVYEFTPLREVRVLRGHTQDAHSVAFHPNGTRLASGSSDQTIRLWSLSTGKEVAVLAGHTRAVQAVRFSADGKRLYSASDDATVRVWDTLPLRERMPR